MGQHEIVLSMEVAGAAEVLMLDHSAALSGRWGAIEIVFENGGDALVGERPDGECASRDGFGASRVNATEQAQHTEAGSKALFRMRAVSERGDHQRFGIRADRSRPALEACRRPCGVAP